MTDPVTSSDVLLNMRGVHKRFGSTHALRGVDLDVRAGEILALIGENGAGKSTLMKVLSGAHAPDEGRMTLAGEPYAPRGPLEARNRGVGMIYQELSIAPDLTVMENVLLGVEPGRGPFVSWRQMYDLARAVLTEVGHASLDPARRAGTLSVAELQLVEIARSLSLGARVLVFDEPTSSLTRRDIDNLFTLLRKLRAQGLGIVYISHFLEEVRAVTDRFIVLRDGASVGAGITKDVSDADIIRMMVGRQVDDLYPRTPHTPGPTVLRVDRLAGRSKPVGASLDLRRGEVLGVAGLVGAGRTELLRTIFGLDPVKRGTVTVASHVGAASPARRWRQGVGMVSEDRKAEGLALGLSIADNITLSKQSRFVLPSRQNRECEPWVKKMSIKCRSPRQVVGDLSGGNQQKVALARLLRHGVDVLLLDEPTRGVDIGAKAQIYQLIDQLAVAGRAILMVSSYLPELLGICDRIAVMSRGELGVARPVGEWNQHDLMAEAIRQTSGEVSL